MIILITLENRVLFAFFGMSDLDHDWLVVGCGGDLSPAIDSDDDSLLVDEESMPLPLPDSNECRREAGQGSGRPCGSCGEPGPTMAVQPHTETAPSATARQRTRTELPGVALASFPIT